MQAHRLAAIFPMLPDAELRALSDDIRANGQRFPIVSWHGEILDGRNRWAACSLAGVDPVVEVREFDDEDGALRFIVSANLTRRHLDESQRAMVAARLATLRDGVRSDRQGASIEAATLSQPAAATLLNVSRPSVQRARAVLDHGAPELVAAVDRGDVPVSVAEQVSRLPEDEQRRIIGAGARETKRAAKAIKANREDLSRRERCEAIVERASGRWSLIYADPPWRYDAAPPDPEMRAIESHYPTMSLDEIKALPIPRIVTDDAVLFLWATSPKLEEAIGVLNAWGFRYRTCMVWVKDRIGLGYYARQRHELLLIGTRGNPPVPSTDARPDSVIDAPRREHSAKPEIVYGLIERMYPEFRRVELFARGQREGWDRWGDQA